MRALPSRTTVLAPVCHGGSRPPRAALDRGQDTGGPRVDGDGQRFRVRTARFAMPGRPATPSPRQLTVGWCRVLVDERGKPLCTGQDWAAIVGRPNR